MFNKGIINSIILTIFSTILIFLLIGLVLIKNNMSIDILYFILTLTVFGFILICLFVILQFKLNYLTTGWILLAISQLLNSVHELNIELISFKYTRLVEDIFLSSAIIFIIFGLYMLLYEKERLLDDLKNVAYNDTLTNLPNKIFLFDKINLSVDEMIKKNKKMSVILIDLDKFKLINDTLGHKIGDYVLKKVADRLKIIIKKDDIISRIGGDKFAIVLKDIRGIESAEKIAAEVKEMLKNPFTLRGKEIHITCSIGISMYPDNGQDPDKLIQNAEIAMYVAKEKGRNSYRVYSDTMSNFIIKKLEATENIRLALKNDEFILFYQPKVNTHTGQIIGLEALVRWQHPTIGMIYPNDFIPIAEEIGLAKDIDKHIIKLACKQIKDWKNRNFEPINIAVNISAKLFNDTEFVEYLENIFDETGIDPSYISIEITETAAMEDIEYAYKILNGLKEKRIKISLDDFGTGYSSLSYLKIFPIDILKIDKFFVDGISKDKRDESLIEAAITMAKALDVKVVAEGVETEEQLEFLKAVDCDEYQGYLFSMPVVVEKIESMLFFNKEAVDMH